MRSSSIVAILLLGSAASAGCSREPEHDAPQPTDIHTAESASSTAVGAQIASEPATPREIDAGEGCKVEVLAEGDGSALAPGAEALIHYSARVKDAEQPFASTKGWYQPLVVRIGGSARSGIVPGLARGLEHLRVGSRARIEVPPALAYGEQGAPGAGVPAGATLVFEVEVVGAR